MKTATGGWCVAAVVIALMGLVAHSAVAGEVGFAMASVPDPPGEPLQVGIWYPTTATPSEQDVGLFTQTVAPGAPVDGGGHGLIVFSHGNGGTFEGHYDTALALAQAGFVVAAMTHTGDNYRDHSRELLLADRPRAVHAVIDYMLASWSGHAALDPAKVGVFGFSAGGFTALVSAGGVPDMTKVAPYCAGHAETFTCRLLASHPEGVQPVPAGSWIADPRIKAAVVAAPAVGFAFSQAGLEKVTIPIQLWRAEDDHILPSPDYAEVVRDALPRPPEYHVVAGADHFDFLAPCSDPLATVAPEICQEIGGFDRAAFHREFDREVVRFFEGAFKAD
jgi:predicted dienelactone hydrolase